MQICKRRKDGTYSFSVGKPTHFLFLLSDFSAFGNPAKKPFSIRENFRKSMKYLLKHELDELDLLLKTGEDFKIDPPVLSKKQNEPKKLEIPIVVPPGNAIKVFSIDSGFATYLVNQGGEFFETEDYESVEEASGVFF